MKKEKNWIEYNSAKDILISLLERKKNYSTLMIDINRSNYGTINKTLKILDKMKLIIDEKKEITKDGKYIGIPRYLWLTPKGKRIAEKLIGIEEILKEGENEY